MPFYEYRCPNGHLFEQFKRMSDPPPEACEVCGASPVETVLYPVAVHFKGSGFYSTDYGKGGGRKPVAGDGGGSSTDATEKKSDAPAAETKKTAEAKD